jgi:TolA-binding protein
MTCPDNLLVASRKGTLTADEQQRLDAHLGQCSLCRLALAVGRDFDAALEMSPGDELIAARIARGPRNIGIRSNARVRRATVVAIAAAGVVAGAGLAAAAIGGWRFQFGRAAPPAVEQPAAPAPAKDPVPERRERVEPAPEPLTPTVVPSAEVREAPPLAPTPTSLSAAELFAKANASRSEGQGRRAIALYGELQRRYPGSAEAEISYVSLGRTLLEQGQAAIALGQFDRYLSRNAQGPLAQEALVGKANALARLGRLDAERGTWETLLARFPKSIYRDRAHERLGLPR